MTIPLNKLFRNKDYRISQHHTQILDEAYEIRSSDGSEIYFASRSRKFFKNFFSLFTAFISSIAIFSTLLTTWLGTMGRSSFSDLLFPIAILLIFIISSFIFLLVIKLLAPVTNINFYKGIDKANNVFSIEPRSGFFIFKSEYNLLDRNNERVLRFEKNNIFSYLRIKWDCYDVNDRYIFSAVENWSSRISRELNLGSLYTHEFNFYSYDGSLLARCRRVKTITDKYKLSVFSDSVPSWMILSASILLDTGEHR